MIELKTQSLIPYLHIIKSMQIEPSHDAWQYPRKEYFRKLLGEKNVVCSIFKKEHWGPLMDNPDVSLEDIKKSVEAYSLHPIEWDDSEVELNHPGDPHPNDTRPWGNLAFYYLVECVRKGVIPEKKLYTLSRGFGDTIEHNGLVPISKGFHDLMESIRDGEMTYEYYMQNRKHLVVMEHRIPVKVIAKQVYKTCLNVRDVYVHAQTLKDNFCLLTKEEDNLLKDYKDSLPKSGDRYDEVGIDLVGWADIRYRHNPEMAIRKELKMEIA